MLLLTTKLNGLSSCLTRIRDGIILYSSLNRRLLQAFMILCFSGLFLNNGYGQTTIWLEDFQDLADGTQVDNGATAWTRDVTACDFTDAGGGYFEVQARLMEALDTDGEAVWYSEWVDISAFTDVKASIDLASNDIFGASARIFP